MIFTCGQLLLERRLRRLVGAVLDEDWISDPRSWRKHQDMASCRQSSAEVPIRIPFCCRGVFQPVSKHQPSSHRKGPSISLRNAAWRDVDCSVVSSRTAGPRYKDIGNQITILHAAFLLVNALKQLPRAGCVLEVQHPHVIQQPRQQHVSAGNMHWISMDVGLFITGFPVPLLAEQVRAIEASWPELSHGRLPADQCWDSDGLHAIIQLYAPGMPHLQIAETIPGILDFAVFQQVIELENGDVVAWLAKVLTHRPPGMNGLLMLSALNPQPFDTCSQVVLCWLQGKLYAAQANVPSVSWLFGSGRSIMDIFSPVFPRDVKASVLIQEYHRQSYRSGMTLSCVHSRFSLMSM